MSDSEICNLMKTTTPLTATPTRMPRKFNPNPCYRCGLPGDKAVDCPYEQKDKIPEIDGKIHHFMETQTPVDKELWADFFNKCIWAQTAKKLRRYHKKFQEAVTAAQSTVVAMTATASVAVPGLSGLGSATVGAKTTKKVTFASQQSTEPKTKVPETAVATVAAGGIAQPTPRKKTTKVKKEVSKVGLMPEVSVPKLSEEEEMILDSLEKSGYFQASDTEGETEVEITDSSESDPE